MQKQILIASSSFSSDEYNPVAKKIVELGHDVTIYNSDKVIAGTDKFTVKVDRDGSTYCSYNGKDISNESVSALWYRKVADFQKPEDWEDKSKALLMQDEIANFHQDIWQTMYASEKWLNAPENILRASNKLGQLLVASQVGFLIPETIVSSDWREIQQSHIFDENNDIIVKMVRGVLIKNGQEMAMPTTILSPQKVEVLRESTVPFPGFFQPYKQKYREWRVTAVGSDIFPVAIYTDSEAKDDWRKHQNKSHVTFKPEKISSDIAEKCTIFLSKYNLCFGAFDFIESDEGEMTFLECNANGQYYRFEELFGLPISNSIVNELVNK